MHDPTALAQLVGLAGVPIVVALVAMLKPWLTNPDLWPPLALALALAINIGIALARGTDTLEAAAAGIITGLAAAGLYEVSKHYQQPEEWYTDDQNASEETK